MIESKEHIKRKVGINPLKTFKIVCGIQGVMRNLGIHIHMHYKLLL
jgi:hypothetical protein